MSPQRAHWLSAVSFRAFLFWLFVALGVAPSVTGCFARGDDESGETDDELVGIRIAERFPTRENVEASMDHYRREPQSARAMESMSLEQYFGTGRQSANGGTLRVEMLKPNPRYTSPPIAFLRAEFHGSDMYWNNRYKDVQLYRLVESSGTRMNPFPEAAHVPNEGAALVRMWTDYTPVSKGAPEGLGGEALLKEVARIAVWSYVSGNVDGPAHNGNNGGFARFKDPSGREFWRGVLIDAGAAWNTPTAEHQPWRTNVLDKGAVKREQIPEDVVNGLIQIARASAEELGQRSKFERVDEGAKEIVRGIRARAQEVLEHYGIQYKTSRLLRLPARWRAAEAPEQRLAA
jgi:hypothetical protein